MRMRLQDTPALVSGTGQAIAPAYYVWASLLLTSSCSPCSARETPNTGETTEIADADADALLATT